MDNMQTQRSMVSSLSGSVIKIILVTNVYTAPILISKAASLLSHSDEYVKIHAQTAFLTYFCNSRRLGVVLEFF